MTIRILTLTLSDTRTEGDDTSGAALREELSAFTLVRHEILPDEPARVQALVRGVIDGDEADAIVSTGGTGIGPRDRTYEALREMFTKELDGFGEAFRRASWEEVGARAMLSRATAGIVGRLVVFALPGSTKAARLGARDFVAPIVAHAVALARGNDPGH